MIAKPRKIPSSKKKVNRKTSNPVERGMREGYRSGLEGLVGEQILRETGSFPRYEHKEDVVVYEVPTSKHKYTPDFKLPNGIVIETKGRFTTKDRKKHLLIKQQYPHLDIRFVFSNSKTKLGKQSPTTYAVWCEKNGFQFADRWIPSSWFKETNNE